MAHASGIVAEVSTNRMASVLSSSKPKRRHSLKFIICARKIYLRYKVENIFVIKRCLCPSRRSESHISGDVLPECYLFIYLFICIAMWLRVKEREH